MLVSCKLTGNPAAVSAYHTKEENYYFSQADGVESLDGDAGAQGHVRIHGALAVALGFAPGTTIDQATFTRLLAGKDVDGNRITRDHKVIGIDLTFSAPKSVSVAGLLTLRDPKIIEAHDQAVLETMREIERHCAATRPKPVVRVPTGNMAYVTVRDGFNRDHDPHLHTHVVVMNMTKLGDKIMALDGRSIMTRDFNKLWGAMYRNKLAARLKELGYTVSYTKKGELRLDAVSLEVEREFSGRRAEILAAKEAGARDMDAWRKTRKEKDSDVEKRGVLESWRERVGRYREKSASENRREALAERDSWFKAARWSLEARQELAGDRGDNEIARWQLAARRATERAACVGAGAIITEYLTELARGETWASMTFAEAEGRFLEQVRDGRLLATDDGRYTTWELTRADRECVAAASPTVGLAESPTVGLVLPRAEARRGVEAYSKTCQAEGLRSLSALQASAAAGILAGAGRVIVVQGDAGAGKTTMLRAVNEVALTAGWDVVGLAVQGVAARKLEEESGIRSRTLASYLASERAAVKVQPLDSARPARLIVLDESSMLDSRGLSELVRRAEGCGDKVVLVGDRNQIQSVGAGKPFERLVETAEASGQLLSLNENYRQRDPALREAVDLARKGRMRESLDLLDARGKIEQHDDAALRRLAIARLYDKETLILTGGRDSRDELNGLIREDLLRRGELLADTARIYSLTRADEDGVKHSTRRQLAVGERITFRENEYKLYDLRNGECGVITKTGEKTIGVRLEGGRELVLELARYSAIDYGYALTTYKSQGQTFDKVVVEADTRVAALQDQRNSYVQITRARDDVRIFTDDKEELREVAGILMAKQDTLDLKKSLAQATLMERRVRDEALVARAQHEAAAKITLAEAVAAQDARRLTGEVMNEGELTPTDRTTSDAASSQPSEPASPQAAPQIGDPGQPARADQSPASRLASASLPSEVSSYDPSVTANIRNFKTLFGEKVLEGTAEILRGELTCDAATGKPQEQVIADRLAMLDQTTAAFTEGGEQILQAPEKVRRVMLERLNREVERRLMLKGELPAADVRQVHESIRTSLLEAAQTQGVRVYNARLVADAGDSEVLRNGCLGQFTAVEEHLRPRRDIGDGEKHRVAEYLGRPESARIFDDFMSAPEQVVTVALVRSGTRGLDEAAQGLPEYVKDTLRDYIARGEIEPTQHDKMQGRGKGPGRERGQAGPLDAGLEL
jgi:conjugative relaxase-like TrwC/TraI family protein